MNLRLIREPSRDAATLGALYVNGVFQCWTCEDAIREVPGQPVKAWKVPGLTAIPAGRYPVVITMSPRFRKRLPLLLNVPGFDGIRIHVGNRAKDTEGCILPGRVRLPDGVGQSRVAFDALFARLEAATGDEIWLTVENPRAEDVAAA